VRYMRVPGRPAAALAALATLAAAVTVTAAGAAGAAHASSAGTAASPPPCSLKPPPGGKTKPTTVTTIGQAYSCIFDHYYAAPTLDDEMLLAAAFAGLTQQLDQVGLDQPDATMPALTGNRDSDWDRFAAVYQRIISALPARNRQQVAEATMNAMIAALNNNHSMWSYPVPQPGGSHYNSFGLGLMSTPGLNAAEKGAAPPKYVTGVIPGSPAARAGVFRPGDVITAVNGSAPFVDGMASPGVFNLLLFPPPGQTVRITLRWPVTGATRTVTLTPAGFNANGQLVTSKLLAGHIGYVKLLDFVPGDASQVLAAISALEEKAKLRGVILDLRGNGGGSPAGVADAVGLFEHGRAYGYGCTATSTGASKCTALYPNRHTPLLHLPLAVLTEPSCASGCEQFASAVKDLHLGTLIGTRTAGIVGAATVGVYTLDDGSALQLATESYLGPDHEIIDGIGVAADYYVATTDMDVITGHDPDIAKALAVLGR
jgi:carboxyl-terminal processing protease